MPDQTNHLLQSNNWLCGKGKTANIFYLDFGKAFGTAFYITCIVTLKRREWMGGLHHKRRAHWTTGFKGQEWRQPAASSISQRSKLGLTQLSIPITDLDDGYKEPQATLGAASLGGTRSVCCRAGLPSTGTSNSVSWRNGPLQGAQHTGFVQPGQQNTESSNLHIAEDRN